jgi:hypothetical protein
MSKFKVVSIHTRDGIVERREVEYFDSLVPAFTRFGTLCATTNGVIVLDEDGSVLISHEPKGDYRVTNYEIMRFQLFMDPDFDRIRKESVHD